MANAIYRGTTPTFSVNVNFQLETLTVGYFTIDQDGETIIEKKLVPSDSEETGDDIINLTEEQENGSNFTVLLTQEDTIKMTAGCTVQVQLRAVLNGGKAVASPIKIVPVGAILKDGVI